ncbi:hypothetical protein ALP29_200484 [Pseudomonas syringae pv. avii]|uniref:Uncharacterized protein n=1 Tax=Pseudomonas syringae pv. avii TaxID=663959 RepID=A0A3M5W2J6_PSESX|nr:hypothetical protein ALP29_200484 [Pseudomonas syringae pv. avii]
MLLRQCIVAARCSQLAKTVLALGGPTGAKQAAVQRFGFMTAQKP